MDCLSNFYVLEGLDGSGTTTQLEILDERLGALGVSHLCTSEPTDGEVGRLLRAALQGRIRLHPYTIAHLFAADRNEHLRASGVGILDRLKAGDLVISDRYLFSSLAYQGAQCGVDFVWSLNSRFPLPSAVIYLRGI